MMKFYWIKLVAILMALPVALFAQNTSELEAPVGEDETICGAGFVTLSATSSIDDPNLLFEWYSSTDGNSPFFLGSLDGSTGKSQYISDFLIADKTFAVRVRLGDLVSPFTYLKAEILNEATIVQQPEIQLCGEAYLEVITNMDSIQSYQWQKLVPDEFGQSFFENLTINSSDSVVLVASETGFYRAIVTDSVGCQAISSEVEVTNDPIVEFIESIYHCFDPDTPGSDEVNLESEYGRSFTEYLWEESLDSVNFTILGTSHSISVSKPTAQAFDTAYYRLTITEQNCSNDTTIAVYWRPYPEGTIRHIDSGIDESDFFYCGTDPEAQRTLRFESTSPDIEISWLSINYSEYFNLADLKTFSGETGPEDYQTFKETLAGEILENFLGSGDEVILKQNDGGPFEVDGGLIFAFVTDTISGCGSYTNGIFADSAFPFPTYGNKLAYDYEPGINFVPACRGEELEFLSYDQTADSYSWLEYDADLDTYTEIDADAIFDVTVDESYEGGTYFLEVTKNGCTGLSESFRVLPVDPPTAEITNAGEQVIACNEIPGILLFGQGSSDVTGYQWYYSADDVNFFEAPGDSAKHFYTATLNGYYKLAVSNTFCSAETGSIYVEIPDISDPDFVEVALEGKSAYCEGDEIIITCNYSGNNTSYFWYYSFFRLDGDDLTIELVELGETSDPNLTLDSRLFGSELTTSTTLYFYILVVDDDCVYGSTNTPFTVTINPSPNIEVVFEDEPMISEVLVCGNETISERIVVNNLTSVEIPNLTYLWTKYNPELDSYDTIPNESTTEYSITEPGRYRSIATTSDNSCFSVSNSLDVLQLPTEITGDTLYCFGNDITLQAIQIFSPDLGIYSYRWFHSTSGTDFSSIPDESSFELILDLENELYGPGFFYFEATYDGCVANSDTLYISENESSFNSVFSVESTQEKGIPFEASVSLGVSSEEISFSWEPSDFVSFTNGSTAIFNFPESFASDSVEIQLMMLSENGCEVLLDQLVIFSEVTDLSFSKFISPNGDGLNDTFRINGLNTQLSNQLKVIDSWGNELFIYNNYYNQNQEAEALVTSLKGEGVYYYIFSTDGEVIKGRFYLRN